MIALARVLRERGHEVTLQTWSKWREAIEAEGVAFAAAPEYQVFPTRERPLKPYQAAVRAAEETVPLVEGSGAEVVVGDILTVAAGFAAELAGRPWATLIPHVLPTAERGFPPYSLGARLPRTPVGRAVWGALTRPLAIGERRGREELNGARTRLGLPPVERLHGGISDQLALVATFPQLEYPRARWDPAVRVTGPLMWEQPFGELELPPGDEPLVLVAPSTSQDPEHRMLRAALDGLAGEPVRVIATYNRRAPLKPVSVPANARLVEWLSYARTMPRCDAVVLHAGHGTLVRALASGVPVVACPAAGDMAENATRAAWAGAGVALARRLITPRGVRLAVRQVLGDPGYAERARAIGSWLDRHDAGTLAAEALEEFAGAGRPLRREPGKLGGWDSNPQPSD